MDERGKIELAERALAAWNRGDLETVISKASEDLEWDLTRSDIPGESHVHRGSEAYLRVRSPLARGARADAGRARGG